MNASLSTDHPILTAKEAAKYLRVSEAWVRDHVTGRRLPALPVIRMGNRRGVLRFRRADLDSFLALHTRNCEALS